MIIGIDARFYGPVGKGLGRYTQEITDRIVKLNELRPELNLSFVVFLSPDNYDEFNYKSERVKKVKLPFRWYSLAEQIKFPFYIKKHQIDLIHFPHFNIPIFCPCKFIVTVHDLILTRFPTMRATTKSRIVYFLKNLAYRFVIHHALKKSEKIITVSEFTRQDIINLFKVNPEKIALSYEGVSDLKARNDRAHTEKSGDSSSALENIPDKFLLYVGSAYPHKNLERLLEAFKLLKESGSDISLLFVGRADYFYDKLKSYAKELALLQDSSSLARVIFLGHVSDSNLDTLYSKARAFIFPSLYEGFGLPPLEAMSASCPVLSSKEASLPEILGDNALYFDAKNVEDIVKKINVIDRDEELRQRLIISAKSWIQKYSWQDCAEKTFDIYLKSLKLE